MTPEEKRHVDFLEERVKRLENKLLLTTRVPTTTIIQFTLSMPNSGSWNGQWSGSSSFYAIVKTFTKKNKDKADKIIKDGPYSFSWEDGWRASISVKIIDAKEKRFVIKHSDGFCGYDWMVESILEHGYIKDE